MTYELVQGNGDDDNAIYRLAGNRLIVRESSDYETRKNHSIRVRVTDVGGFT